ncbi:quinoprotein relay system zinc metallohydrolase 1 [Oceanospirillum multiglobuliferum]|uniref:quinoprotein relay system zinc metallohydrolase 1 n=1 Tax=Oceanospirillum multiglobuliferum TaxID=64969 RepID=UPI00099B027E|nr:quinoprotein relay system zinc metallohydrolase 1 [Oceanospirillum multiglobuliferum]SJZ90806.1 quinoprotein relay system zinc metallohydrolase 1 [Oceanospirillum multiglobuliferum]
MVQITQTLPSRVLHQCLVSLALLFSCSLYANIDYPIAPEKIAKDTWVLWGANEIFSAKNGGHIANIGVIITAEASLVFDSGPSKGFADALNAWIKTQGGGPVRYVLNSHAHPDHFLGNQVFQKSALMAAAPTRDAIAEEGSDLAENLYRMVGAKMQGTQSVTPEKIATNQRFNLGEHQLEIKILNGHTNADLVLFDHSTGVLFTGDLVFYQRALTTPHAVLKDWLTSLDQLDQLPYKTLIAGHGPIDQTRSATAQTRQYLLWLDKVMQQGAEQGLSMAEMLSQWRKNPLREIALSEYEFVRSLAHWYPAYEVAALK